MGKLRYPFVTKNPKTLPRFAKYCPRCDREFVSQDSEQDAMTMVSGHLKTAHPNYSSDFDD